MCPVRFVNKVPGTYLCAVHDLHIWAMSTTKTALTAHLVTAGETAEAADVIQAANQAMRERFNIEHTTLQVERDDQSAPCPQQPEDSV